MSLIADLHIHSYLSRATSKECTLEGLQYWAQLKGVRVVGTGDFTHPTWFRELSDKLVPSAPGLFRLPDDVTRTVSETVPKACRGPVEFMLTGEISSIYKRDGRVRKVHSILLAPDLETVATINARLDAIGNIKSDGRPILGLDPRDLLEIALEANPKSVLIPAHIWTPWFSMLGSKSGFDSALECFGELTQHIFAVETGLSSDPPMNWRVSSLDDLALISNSDLHSPRNLARNANVFHCDPDFYAFRNGLRRKDPAVCGGTIDMFPEEGKYHHDGHRKCGVVMEPEESLAHDCLCPVCGKPLVLGVLHRVVKLADRTTGARPSTALPCQYIIPLPELLSELYDCGPNTKKVNTAYFRLLDAYGPELTILRNIPPQSLADAAPPLLGEAVRRVRSGEVHRKAGFDGEYGEIRVFSPGEQEQLTNQGIFFPDAAPETDGDEAAHSRVAAGQAGGTGATGSADEHDQAVYHLLRPTAGRAAAASVAPQDQLSLFETRSLLDGLTPAQAQAASVDDAPLIIVAGPGTGKTRTLTRRIAHLVSHRFVDPGTVLAVTFTNRAAREMQQRLEDLLGHTAGRVRVSTFHAFALDVLRQHASAANLPEDFHLVDQAGELELLRSATSMPAREAARALEAISSARREGGNVATLPGGRELEQALHEQSALPLDEIVPRCVTLLRTDPALVAQLGVHWLCVDEYQDINRPQYELVKLLSPEGKGLCVIGDTDQAIYGFRGADVSCFLTFAEDFPGAKTLQLKCNFRSSGNVVAAAGQVIAPGRTPMSVTAESAHEAGLRLRFHEAPSAAAEAEFIAHEVEKWLGGTAMFSVDSSRVTGTDEGGEVGLSDIAVLVRLRAQLGPLQQALSRLGLPVQSLADRPFAEQPGAQDLLKALRALPSEAQHGPAALAVDKLLGTGKQLSADAQGVLDQAQLLAAGFAGTLRQFLDSLQLRISVDRYDRAAERVTLLTLHAAKGLEFPIVFLAGCEDGIIPFVREDGKPTDPEEERRLLFVGMTRAQQVLYLTCARRRALFGTHEDRLMSPYLNEVAAHLRQGLSMPQRKPRPRQQQLEFKLG